MDGPKSNSISGIRLQLYLLGLLRFTEAVAWTSIFPYAYFMVRSFQSDDGKYTALYASMLVSIFTFCEFLSNIPWAWVADRIGRKNTLLIGIIGSIVSATLFGLSRNMVLATISRAIGGLMNPNVGVVQTCIGELAKKEQQAKAFSIVPYLRGLGSVIGPVIGGFLAEPLKHYPSAFSGSDFWIKFPYFLPNLVVVILLFFTLLSGFLFFEETLPTRRWPHQDIGVRLGRRICDLAARLQVRRRQSVRRSNVSAFEMAEPPLPTEAVGSQRDVAEIQTPSPEDGSAGENVDTREEEFGGKIYTRQVILQILSVSLLAFHKVASDIIMPVFLASPLEPKAKDSAAHRPLQFSQGMGLDPHQIGPILLSQACIAVVGQYLVVPYIINSGGALRVYRICLWIYAMTYIITPFTARLHKPGSVVAITFDLLIKVLLSSTGYTCSAILITNTISSKIHLAKVNGAAASFGCLARSIGPLVAGKLFDWGVRSRFVIVPFWILSGVALCGAIESIFLADNPD